MSDKPEFDEINFKKVVKSPIRWFGLIYFYILLLVMTIGLYYNYHLDRLERNEIAPVMTDSSNIFEDIKEVKGSTSAGINLNSLMNPSAVMIKNGEKLYKTNCSACHGEDGKGDGPAAVALNPKPRNFHSDNGWKNGRKLSEMYKTLTVGISGSAMTSYSQLSPQDRFDLIFYIRKFTNDYPKVEESEIDALNKEYNLSGGQSVASKIPVALAKEKIIEDASPEIEKVSSLILKVDQNPNDQGAILINKISDDKFRIFSFLVNNTQWNAGVDDFVKTITASSPVNGFNEKIVTLSNSEWIELYNYLNKLFSQVG
jgi:cytochrome c2